MFSNSIIMSFMIGPISHYRGLGFNNLQRVGFGKEKIHTMPWCYMKKHYGTQLYQTV
jgi:hypothetical protein